MRLPDFNTSNIFIKIKKQMNIKENNIIKENFCIKFEKLNIESAQFEVIENGKGLDINLEDLDIGIDNTISYKDKNVILYIRDQYSNRGQYKYHVSWCRTLRDMRNNNKLNRYVISRRTDGKFSVNVLDEVSHEITDEGILQELGICKNCLSELNYKGYNEHASNKVQIYENFSLEDFLQYYDTKFNQLPKYTEFTAPKNEYTDEWREISNKYKEFKNWICESCGGDFSRNKSYLDTHHIDSNKYNNNYSNLKALCKDCHANEYNHQHYKKLVKSR